MTRWIPLSWFKEVYGNESDVLSPEGHAAFMEQMQSDQAQSVCLKHSISITEFQTFLAQLRNPQNVVFHGWVEQDQALKETLIRGKVTSEFRDQRGVLNHTFADAFRDFVSPFLSPILLKGIPQQDMAALAQYLSFAPLLEPDTRPVVEAQLFKPIRSELHVLKDAHVLQREQDLIERVQPLCSDAIVYSVNRLSKGSYAMKMEYVDSVMDVIRTPACTVRFANWILKQMERIELNKEHQYKLVDLRRELAEGKLQVKQFDKTSTGIRWRRILLFTFIALLIGGGFYLWYFKPFSDPEKYDVYENAGMKEFSDDELKEIDSLVAIIDKESFMEGVEVDPNIIIQNGQSISLREPLDNDLMEQIFSDFNMDASLKENYVTGDCLDEADFTLYPGTQKLEDYKGLKSIKFRNESDYDVIVFVTNNLESGDVYSMYVKSGTTVDFKMDVNDVLTAVAGNEYVPFKPPLGSRSEEKPSSAFHHHFCETDNNYFESINTSLVLESTTKSEIKFMVTGDSGSIFQLIDIHDVARPY